jgi:hypothetical protein
VKVSIIGLLRNAGADVHCVRRLTRARADAIDDGLKRLAWALWTLSRTDEPGSVAINTFATYYLRELPLQAAIEALPLRPTRDIPQPGLVRFGLGELHGNLVTVISRASEGKTAIREFFDCYVFERAPDAPKEA